MLLTYFLSSFTYMLLGLFFALIIKNTALSILTFIGYRTFLEPVLFLIFRENPIRWFFPARATTKLTPLPNLIEIFQEKMNEGEPPEDLTSEILPGGIPLWGTILVVIGYVTLLIILSYRLMDRKRLT